MTNPGLLRDVLVLIDAVGCMRALMNAFSRNICGVAPVLPVPVLLDV